MEGRELHVNVMELEIDDFDLILGMDMLAKYGANIDCKRRTVTFSPEGEEPFVFVGSMCISRVPRISALKAKELLNQGYSGYLAYVTDVDRSEESGPGETRIVCEYLDVFPENLSGLQLKREIEFAIDLLPETEPVSKAP